MNNYFKKPIYLDYQSTTPIDPRVLTVMQNSLANDFGNPHSKTHYFGWHTEAIIEKSAEQIANLIGANADDLVFTSGATEANNMAIRCFLENHLRKKNYFFKNKKNIITVKTEHESIIQPCQLIKKEGCKITYLKVNSKGFVNLNQLQEKINKDTLLVSVMAANNEIGVIQPIKEIGRICQDHNVLFHVDAAQAFGKIKLDVNDMNIDLMSISAHKIYGPKGIGAFYIKGRKNKKLQPLIVGGGQQNGMRAGTLPTSLIVGFAEAANICANKKEEEVSNLKNLHNKLYEGLMKIPGTKLNGPKENRILENLNFRFQGIDADRLIVVASELAISSSSACSSVAGKSSHVLKAIGLNKKDIKSSVRFGLGRFTTEEDVDYAIDIMHKKISHLRKKAMFH